MPLVGLLALGVIWSWRALASSSPAVPVEAGQMGQPDVAAVAAANHPPGAQGGAAAVQEPEGTWPGPPAHQPGAAGPGSHGGQGAGAVPPDGEATPSPVPAPDRTVWVHVAGAVQRPGVYRLPADGRIVDAVQAAGGPTDEAALHAINLAAPLVDGARIEVPNRRDVQAGRVVVAPGVGTVGRPGGADGGRPYQVDINSAGQAELEQLPGIGPTLAQRIIADREIHGPFRSPEDLGRVAGIGDKKLAQLLPHIRTGP